MKMLRLTPVLMVDAIEPVLPFWEDALGFKRNTEVPHGDHLGFVILERDGIEVMYQTKASIEADVGPVAKAPMRGTFLFFQVENLDEIERRLKGVEPVVPRRKTFYGSDELIVRPPCGNVVTFAQFPA